MKTETPTYQIRAYEPTDEAAVMSLLRASLGGGPAGERPVSFFRWKHLEGPFGPSFMLVADADGEIVGLRAFLRWEWHAGERTMRAVRAVDTATHPAWQGRGIFSALTRAAIEDMTRDGIDFIFNTPNDKSLPGYLKMGWSIVTRLPIWIRVARPIGFAARSARILPARDLPMTGESVADALAAFDGPLGVPTGSGDRLATRRTAEYLHWRYADAPLLAYRAVRTDDSLVIYRLRARGRLREATVTELFAPDIRSGRRALRALRRETAADHLTAHFAAGTDAQRAFARGAVRMPRGPVFTARRLQDAGPDPLAFDNWALSAGDLEVF